MPIFEYTALNRLGRQESGTIQADSLADARRSLREARVHVVELGAESAEVRQAPAVTGRTISFCRIRPRQLASATRQLATLVRAGMPLVPALGALAEQSSGRPLARIIARVRDRVNEGATLAAALQEHPRVFSDLYVNLVKAGEASGALERILLRLADMLEKRVSISNKVKAALAYPLFMAVLGAGVVMFLLSFVIPSIAKLFLQMNRELPWPTTLLINVSSLVEHNLWAVVLAVVVAFAAARLWLHTSGGRFAWDRLKLKMPLVGGLVLKIAISRFTRTLGVLLASGVPILQALDIVKPVTGNAVLSGALDTARDSVGHGDTIADPLRRSGVVPPVVFHTIALAEGRGNVEEGLLDVADAYDNEVETAVAALTSILEPVLILVMGAIVGFIVLAVLLPIFDINQAIR